MANPVPASLANRGITGMADNLPPGASLDIARDFLRIFRPEIETRVLGWKSPRRPASADFSKARP